MTVIHSVISDKTNRVLDFNDYIIPFAHTKPHTFSERFDLMEKDQILYAAEQLGVKPEVKEIIKKDYRKESTEIPEKDYEKLLSFLEADGVVEFSFVRHLCSSSSVIIRRWNCCGSWVRMIEAIRFFLEREEERISGGRCSLRFC